MIGHLQAAATTIDYGEVAALALAGFFVVLAFVLLVRYREISQQITSSSDLGRDLWQALETRLRKQDERVLEMMSKLDAIQSRSAALRQFPSATFRSPDVEELGNLPNQEPRGVVANTPRRGPLDSTEMAVVQLLGERPRTSIEIKALIGKSREHTARMLKALFEGGFVTRDDSNKPFVYQLTDAGKRYLSAT